MADNLRVVIASPHERHDAIEQTLRARLGLEVLRVREQSELDSTRLNAFMPSYVFFPHWSWKIPADIFEGFECVIFHMTDVPFGRGGSPLQNLVERGIEETRLTALRCGFGCRAGIPKASIVLAGYGGGDIDARQSIDGRNDRDDLAGET